MKILISIQVCLILSLGTLHGQKRAYLKNRLHDITRDKPIHVYPKHGVYISPPPDAIVLFDGTNLEAWDGDFIILDSNRMVANKRWLYSKQSFGSIQLHLEWRVHDTLKVEGQKGGNSGVFLMSLYEIQILESYKNITYPDGQAGAIYGQFPPLVNASTPQGTWNSYDIFFKAPFYKEGKVVEKAMVTVMHNGVIIQFNQEFEGPTVYKKIASYPESHPEKAPLGLQYHGDPIEYRNIWVRELN